MIWQKRCADKVSYVAARCAKSHSGSDRVENDGDLCRDSRANLPQQNRRQRLIDYLGPVGSSTGDEATDFRNLLSATTATCGPPEPSRMFRISFFLDGDSRPSLYRGDVFSAMNVSSPTFRRASLTSPWDLHDFTRTSLESWSSSGTGTVVVLLSFFDFKDAPSRVSSAVLFRGSGCSGRSFFSDRRSPG